MRVYGNFNGTSTNPSGTSSSVFWSAFLKARDEKLSYPISTDYRLFFVQTNSMCLLTLETETLLSKLSKMEFLVMNFVQVFRVRNLFGR